jgi:hypothetical protein
MSQVRSSIGIALVVVVLLSAGAFILRKATDKEDSQTVHVNVAEGGTATIHTSQVKTGAGRYSVYLEKATEGKGATFGFKIRF